MKLSELGEVGLLAELERRGLARRIEHDAAELPGGLVVTQDALVQDVHFRLDRISWRDLGFRAAAVNQLPPDIRHALTRHHVSQRASVGRPLQRGRVSGDERLELFDDAPIRRRE